jgi:hypothetical protein
VAVLLRVRRPFRVQAGWAASFSAAGQESLERVVDTFNAAARRLPWLENREVVVSLTPTSRPQGDP